MSNEVLNGKPVEAATPGMSDDALLLRVRSLINDEIYGEFETASSLCNTIVHAR